MARHPGSQDLAAFFDGEGDRETAAHVASCDRCGAKVDELRRLRAHIRSAPLPDPLEAPPPPLTTTVSRPAGAPAPPARANPLGAGPLVLVFILLLVVLLIVLL